MDQQHTYLWTEHIPGGCHWSGIVRRGTTLRLMDSDCLCLSLFVFVCL